MTIDIRELPARLEEALALAASGGEAILTDCATPRARIVPLGGAGPQVAGAHAGEIQAAPDFNAPLPDDF
jgi:antitoxin (DNA-binding transcriptional repressor) of toxin-antitoxin stability system